MQLGRKDVSNLLEIWPGGNGDSRIHVNLLKLAEEEVRKLNISVWEFFQLDLPLRDVPALKKEYFASKGKAYGEAIRLPQTLVTKLSKVEVDIDEWDNSDIEEFFGNTRVAVTQKKKMEKAISISRLSGENLEMIRAFNGLETSAEALITWDRDAWKDFLNQHSISLPIGEVSQDSYIDALLGNLEQSFPHGFLVGQIPNYPGLKNWEASLDVFEELSDRNLITLEGNQIILSPTQWSGSEEDKQRILSSLEPLQVLLHVYNGLGIDQVLRNRDISWPRKRREIPRKREKLERFFTQNPSLNILETDFTKTNFSANFDGIAEEEKSELLSLARNWQRIRNLARNTSNSLKMLQAGFSSAHDILRAGEQQFIQATGLGFDESKRIYKEAYRQGTAVTHFMQNLKDLRGDGFAGFSVNNHQQLFKEISTLPDYESLFGSQDFCHCDHCHSILIPTAYLVDMMLFVEDKVTRKVFTGENAGHFLKLQNRRPDLWEIPLTCDNTHEEIPYLEVVNEVLESFIKKNPIADGNNAGDDFPDLNIPMQKTRNYLAHFNLTLEEIYALLNAPEKTRQLEVLNLSTNEANIIDKRLFQNGEEPITGNPSQERLPTLEELLSISKLSREELDQVLKSKFLPELSKIQIEPERPTEEFPTGNEGFKSGTFTKGRFQKIQSYVRLWRGTPFSIAEFDDVLSTATATEDFQSEELGWLKIADLILLHRELGLNEGELCALLRAFPTKSPNFVDSGHLSRIFDIDAIVGKDIHHAAVVGALQAGLSLSHEELQFLVDAVKIESTISHKDLGYLFGLSLLARRLEYSISELSLGISICSGKDEFSGLGFKEISRLLEFDALLQRTGVAISDLMEINTNRPLLTSLCREKLNWKLSEIYWLEVEEEKEEHEIDGSGNENREEDEAVTRDEDETENGGETEPIVKEKKYVLPKEHTLWLVPLKNIFYYSTFSDNIKSKIEFLSVLNNSITIKDFEDFLIEETGLSSDSLTAIHIHLGDSVPIFEQLRRILDLSEIAKKIGLDINSLIGLININESNELIEFSELLQDALASKYPNEEKRKEIIGALDQSMLESKRDSLCDYIIDTSVTSKHLPVKLRDYQDIYHYLLLDVEMGSCFRTSRILAAISSVQLYIHRCLFGLEKSEDLTVSPSLIPAKEWEWRKNYRVWEANRKVFVYPENYIDPALRNSKTVPFQELENELLQQSITLETAEAAYKKYLVKFTELAHLRYAGAYYHEVDEQPVQEVSIDFGPGMTARMDISQVARLGNPVINKQKTCYYLFARTHLDPYQYWFRAYYPLINKWEDWKKIDLPIEAEEVSCIVHLGKIYLYWTDVQHQINTKIEVGNASSESVEFKVSVKYAHLEADNRWTSPQQLYLGRVEKSKVEIELRLQLNEPGDLKDHVVETFKRKVFGKPYVSRTKNNSELLIRHIYSPGKNIQWEKFKMKGQSITKRFFSSNFSERNQIEFRIPETEFDVRNQAFPIHKDIEISYITTGRVIGKVHLMNPVSAIVEWKFKWWSFKVEIAVEHVSVFPESIHITEYIHNLYKPHIDPNREFEKNLKAISNSSLQREYEANQAENDALLRFVEDGNRYFTLKNRVLSQLPSGTAHLGQFGQRWGTIPLSTVLTDELNQVLMEKGLDQFLTLRTQEMATVQGQMINFSGPYGAYYWELFFHIPLLIAHQLNANEDFNGAKWWLEKVFDPTPQEDDAINSKDHYWRFREFRKLELTTLESIFTNERAVDVYLTDPFNPHAIADLRVSAYQKAVVMKYLDNLLDWGDHLFAQDTQESLVEASLLYTTALDILGKKPVIKTSCSDQNGAQKSFKLLQSGENNQNPFLTSAEDLYHRIQKGLAHEKKQLESEKHLAKILDDKMPEPQPKDRNYWAVLSKAKSYKDLQYLQEEDNSNPESLPQTIQKPKMVSYWERKKSIELQKDRLPIKPISGITIPGNKPHYNYEEANPAIGLTDLASYFCVPPNLILVGYHDRVNDRLNKIRHCMNIHGIKRSLPLFQPPIDPMLLIRAKALGVNLSEVNPWTDKQFGHYRFVFLLEKAKQYAQQVQAFGNALMTAIEKGDSEELMALRNLQEQNLLKLSKDQKRRQIEEANRQLQSAKESLVNMENREEYYRGLLSEGLNGLEKAQQHFKHSALGVQTLVTGFYGSSSLWSLLPQIGSPFSLNYGGEQLGDSPAYWADMLRNISSIFENLSASAGMRAGFNRRNQEWSFQLKTAKQDRKQAQQQELAAEIRLRMAERDQEIYERQVTQNKEVLDFYGEKFSNLGFYHHLRSQLNSMHRECYQMALNLAKDAERAMKSELGVTPDSPIPGFGTSYLGILSGEDLMMQLNKLELTFLENQKRLPEITQHFSLYQINPEALINLKITGKCTFVLPELAFDLLYPGQYNRRIRGVRISIPCIAGPYTNISAELKLVGSKVRQKDNTLLDVEIGNQDIITTSSAQNDSGTFEFNFRDERYLPFEYAGAVESEWELSLPSKIRSFNYDTISDVIIHMNYTANTGNRQEAEDRILDKIKAFTEPGMLYGINLKHDYPNEWHQLKRNGGIDLSLEKSRLPYFVQSLQLKVTHVSFITKKVEDVESFKLIVHGMDVTLSLKTLENNKTKFLQGDIKNDEVNQQIDFGKTLRISAAADDLEKLEELFLVVRCGVA
ncbi:hypothetical protein C943_04144 [Mariniradius saccharolyticus AK6]|uniref:Uncharacterized protein n=1 Tax=Mariniradius saccharolyticus AK6 TaxID=1239962 RepID=M7X8V6_9BACT|nr:neuraminidase-like domain-containing protein [Mariniradius saccharolyticus]EMS33825.1 hypothetical protein C943_04144 [Mariniradius saccharolyticus AK6]